MRQGRGVGGGKRRIKLVNPGREKVVEGEGREGRDGARR